MSEGAERLRQVVDQLLREDVVELAGAEALERLATMLASAERLKAATLLAVRDMDHRELYALDAAGSARGWLRRQPGGEDGQVTLARRLAARPIVTAALADARIGLRTATQLCTALEHVPADLDDALLTAVVQDGVGMLLREHTGGTSDDQAAAAAVLAQRAADATVLDACVADTSAAPAPRVEPALVLLAERLPAAQVGSALQLLLEPLQPDAGDVPESDPYYLELRILADGDVDIRGLLDPETGQSLAAEIERRLTAANVRARRGAAEAADEANVAAADDPGTSGDAAEAVGATDAEDGPHGKDATATASAAELDGTDATDATDATDQDEPLWLWDGAGAATDTTDATDASDEDEPLRLWDAAGADVDARAARRAARPGGDLGRADRSPDRPLRLVSIGRRRHDALRDLLVDASAAPPGEPPPVHLTIVASLDAVVDRLGALPAQLVTPGGRSTVLRPETLQRLGCSSELDAVLLDAMGNPVGASSTRRMPNRRERRALRAKWGSTCAVAGCSHTRTVPHHVVPWWLSHLTRLADLVPLCSSCHHDLHEGRRTLRLRDGRLIDDHGWVSAVQEAAA